MSAVEAEVALPIELGEYMGGHLAGNHKPITLRQSADHPPPPPFQSHPTWTPPNPFRPTTSSARFGMMGFYEMGFFIRRTRVNLTAIHTNQPQTTRASKYLRCEW